MKNVNIGIANLSVSNQLEKALRDDTLMVETKKRTSKLVDLVKESPILQLEFKVFNNLEKKHINDSVLATRYIDNNIKLFEIYTIEELNEEHNKLKSFVNESIPETDKVKLYNSISALIEESLKIGDDVNVDKLHESFDYVLNHIKIPKEKINENEYKNINGDVIEMAINKFNEKYSSMDESDLELFNRLIHSDLAEKRNIFEEYRQENLSSSNKLLSENSDNDKMVKLKNKLDEMKFDPDSVDSDIIKLHELKKVLI